MPIAWVAVASRPGELVIFQGHPSWRSMLTFHLRGAALTVGGGVAAGLLSAAIEGSVRVLWVAAAVLVVFAAALGVGALRRRRLTYTITTERLTIQIGLLSRERHECRLERVQNVSFTQSLLERMLGVGTVDFDTAAGAGFEFRFDGVEDPRAVVEDVNRALGGGPPAHSG